MSSLTLDGHNILITGGARGLGAAFAKACKQAGAQVIIADILVEQGQALAAAEGYCFIEVNLRDHQSIKKLLDQVNIITKGCLDGLINNAAMTSSGGKAMTELSDEIWDSVFEINVRGLWQLSAAALPLLKASKRGRIVNLASDTALWGAPNLMAYAASKGAIISMTRCMARELGEDLITVNAIAPGLTLCEATQYVPQARHQFYQDGRAIKREQLPSDITAAVVFLLSEPAGFITGQLLPVNGGFIFN